jgi:hypothetical protein
MQFDRWPPVALAVIGVAALGLWLFIAWRQIFFPLELFGHEGAIVDHIRRLLDGQPIYGPPEIMFVPFLYTPGFYLVCAALAWAGDIAFVVPRSVSAVATLVSMACLALLTWRLTGRGVWAIVAIGGFALGASRVHAWYALAQVDNLFLMSLALAVTVGHSARAVRGFFLVGLIFAAAFWFKQIGLVAGLLYAGVVLTGNWRHALAIGVGMAIGIAPCVAWLIWASDGWFFFYAFEIPAHFGIQPLALVAVLLRDCPLLAPSFAAAGLVLWRLWKGGERDLLRRLLAIALCLFGTAALGRAHPGGHVNTLLPAIWLMALGLGAGIGVMWERKIAIEITPRKRTLIGIAALLQFALLAYDPDRFLPSANGAVVLAEIRAKIAAAPQPVLLPGTGYLVGEVAGADHVAVNDVWRTDEILRRRFLDDLEVAMKERRYKSVVLEDGLRLRWLGWHEPYYRNAGLLSDDIDAQRVRTGIDYGPVSLIEAR